MLSLKSSMATSMAPLRARPYKALKAVGIRQYTFGSFLVTPAELHAALKSTSRHPTERRVVPLCAAWFLPNDPYGRTGLGDFRAAHVPHARFFDLDSVKDNNSPYPHMLPSAGDFASAMGALGITRRDAVVVYDTKALGIFSAPRVAWTLQVFGHGKVHILNNTRLWLEQGFPAEVGDQEEVESTTYPVPELDAAKVASFGDVREVVLNGGKGGDQDIRILDARSKARWEGLEPEPRPGLPSGHIPGSISLAFTSLLNPETKAFLPPSELREVFKRHGVDKERYIVSTCGTGVTAAIIDTALRVAGFLEGKRRLYDGSWTEWAQRVQPHEKLIRRIDIGE